MLRIATIGFTFALVVGTSSCALDTPIDTESRGGETSAAADGGEDPGCEYESCAEPAEPDPGTVICDALTGCEEEVVEGNPVDVITLPDAEPGPPPEIPCDGIDQDGNGHDLCDIDSDGDEVPDHLDCEPDDPTVNRLEVEIFCDGKDQNCNGFDDCDSDGDGYFDRIDCDPDDPTVTSECDEQEPGPTPE